MVGVWSFLAHLLSFQFVKSPSALALCSFKFCPCTLGFRSLQASLKQSEDEGIAEDRVRLLEAVDNGHNGQYQLCNP